MVMAQPCPRMGLQPSDIISLISAALTLVALGVAVVSAVLAQRTINLSRSAAREERCVRDLERLQRLISPLRGLQIAATAAIGAASGPAGGRAYSRFLEARHKFEILLTPFGTSELPTCTSLMDPKLTPDQVRTLVANAEDELLQRIEAERVRLAGFV